MCRAEAFLPSGLTPATLQYQRFPLEIQVPSPKAPVESKTHERMTPRLWSQPMISLASSSTPALVLTVNERVRKVLLRFQAHLILMVLPSVSSASTHSPTNHSNACRFCFCASPLAFAAGIWGTEAINHLPSFLTGAAV